MPRDSYGTSANFETRSSILRWTFEIDQHERLLQSLFKPKEELNFLFLSRNRQFIEARFKLSGHGRYRRKSGVPAEWRCDNNGTSAVSLPIVFLKPFAIGGNLRGGRASLLDASKASFARTTSSRFTSSSRKRSSPRVYSVTDGCPRLLFLSCRPLRHTWHLVSRCCFPLPGILSS